MYLDWLMKATLIEPVPQIFSFNPCKQFDKIKPGNLIQSIQPENSQQGNERAS
jgi:hypothetical protein